MKYYEELSNKLTEMGIEEDKVNQLVEFSKKTVPLETVPSTKYNEKVEALKENDKQLKSLTENLNNLKENTQSVEDYQIKIKEINNNFETYKNEAETRVKNLRKTSMLKDTLLNEGADKENIDLLLKDFNIKDMNLVGNEEEGYKIEKLEEIITPVKEKRQRFFVKEEFEGNEPGEGDSSDSKETMNRMRKIMGVPTK